MILKGNARGGASNLARHLMNMRDNDRVEVADVRGVAAQDLYGALMDMEAVASGAKAEKHLYSLSINPRRPLTREQYMHAIDRIERGLGLAGQARAVVFHHKESKATAESREHAHVVWSRIDEATMTAKQLSFDRLQLRALSRELAIEFGHEVPKNIANDRGAARFADRFNRLTYAEQGQAKRTGLDPEQRKAEITAAFHAADSGVAFINALEERGYYIARGDRRGFVIVDRAGEVHALGRQIEGVRTKDVAAKLAPLTPDQLPTVQAAKDFLAQRQRAQADRNSAYAGTITDAGAQERRHAELQQAHRAELKAITAKYAAFVSDARTREAAAIERAVKAVREVHRPQWRELFERQEAERQGFADVKRSFVGRLAYFLHNRDMIRFHPDGRGILANAFNWLARGDGAGAERKIEAAHVQERRALGREQRTAQRAAERDVRKEFAEFHRELAVDRRRDVQTLKAKHRLQLVESEQHLGRAPVELKGHYKIEEERARKSESVIVEKHADAARRGATKAERREAARKEVQDAMRNRPDFERKL